MQSVKFDRPTLVTITSPTCGGKNHLLEGLVAGLGFQRIVSTTDRSARDGEIEGTHYNFISTERSKELEANGELAELITYNGVRYGVTHVEMQAKLQAGAPPPIVILEPQGIQIYREYCSARGYGIFKIYVDTTESIRLSRLVQRTSLDVIKALKSLQFSPAPTQAEMDAAAVVMVSKVIGSNNKRMQAIIEQERHWGNTNIWDAIVSGTNLDKALADVAHGIKNRNKRASVYS